MNKINLICFSHLRWDFVFQRPQQVMTRMTEWAAVFYWEEPVFSNCTAPSLTITKKDCQVSVVTPALPEDMQPHEQLAALRKLLNRFTAQLREPIVRWYYTPQMLSFSRETVAVCTVYDCMDELSNFRFAPPDLAELEKELFSVADIVFTGGFSLYEAKRRAHPAVYLFPSSVELVHFRKARGDYKDPSDQSDLPHPRLGFFGVIDERMDLALLKALARARPGWSLILLGPVVKIDANDLPREPNIHYLGMKSYEELPQYAAGWRAALMPFAMNESTRFISPTKTPEYLAAGLPVISTPIVDVQRQYGGLQAVEVANGHTEFLAACERALALAVSGDPWLEVVDDALADMSWDNVSANMLDLIKQIIDKRRVQSITKRYYDYLVVGAGFAGAVMAERLASQAGKRVLVVDRRPHIAGNAHDHFDDAGIIVHRYGPHIFHTNSHDVFQYLSQFTGWRPYEHRVLADVDGMLVPIPINRTTLNSLYGLNLGGDDEVAAFIAGRAEGIDTIRSSADVVLSTVGRDLYEKFFQGYTRKQWGVDPSRLDKSVTARVPTRTNDDDRYFTDRFQAMPNRGYTAMFERMLDHPNIEVHTSTDFAAVKRDVRYDKLVFTGPIDEYFGYCYGRLPYRSLTFQHETLDSEWFQPAAVVNYPSQLIPFTRITEYKRLTGQKATRTSISYEFPCQDGDPYYPIPNAENHELFRRYEALADTLPDVVFVGRLATYRYYNMDQVVGQALAAFRRITGSDRRHSVVATVSEGIADAAE